MAAPVSLTNTSTQSIDTIYGAAGDKRVKLAVGSKAVVGLDAAGSWHGAASHADGDTFSANDGVMVGAGVDADTGLAARFKTDASGRQSVIPILRPMEFGALGHYRLAVTTGSIGAGAGAGSEILQFRWTSASQKAVISKILIDGMYASTAFAAGQILLAAYVARSFTVAGTGGGTATLTGNNQKMQTTPMGTASVGEVRTATTAALTAGTKTLDANAFAQVNAHSAQFGIATPVIGLVGPSMVRSLYEADLASGEHPLVLEQNEGFVVKATVPATGVWVIGLTIVWAETALFT